MANRADQTLKMPICYVVIGPDRADSGIPNHRTNPRVEIANGQGSSAFQVRFSVAGSALLGGRGTVLDPVGATELLHRLGTGLDTRVYGPLGPARRFGLSAAHRLAIRPAGASPGHAVGHTPDLVRDGAPDPSHARLVPEKEGNR